ncbi:hypothetical protein DM46_1416 [Burkholderia mallei]|nr:hypothetical protein DM46_1416 [Burkholderia mallei]
MKDGRRAPPLVRLGLPDQPPVPCAPDAGAVSGWFGSASAPCGPTGWFAPPCAGGGGGRWNWNCGWIAGAAPGGRPPGVGAFGAICAEGAKRDAAPL